jgi:hypothetical protein
MATIRLPAKLENLEPIMAVVSGFLKESGPLGGSNPNQLPGANKRILGCHAGSSRTKF